MRSHAERAVARDGIILVIAAIASAGAFFTAFWLRYETFAHTNAVICEKVHRLDQAVSLLISDSVPTVSELNRVSYYRNHPEERADVIQRARIRIGKQLRILANGDCTSIP